MDRLAAFKLYAMMSTVACPLAAGEIAVAKKHAEDLRAHEESKRLKKRNRQQRRAAEARGDFRHV
jgi:hypothetical protein